MPELPADFDLALVLTAAGATVSAALIASLLELLKKVPVVGPFIDDKREPGFGVLFSALLVAYAVAALSLPIDGVSLFGYFLAFLGIAGLSSKAHDVASTVASSGS